MAIPKGCKRDLELARQACLYGEGDGRPVMNVKRLMELAGVSEQTIGKHLPSWQAEREEILAKSNPAALGISLSKKQLEQNTKDLDFLRNQINLVKFEIDSTEKIAARLAEWMDKFDGNDIPTALQIFASWERSCGQKASLRSQFVQLKKLWDEKSAIDGLRDVALVREREMEKGRVKIALKKEGSEAEPRNVGPTGNAVFVRRGAAQEAVQLDPVRDDEDED